MKQLIEFLAESKTILRFPANHKRVPSGLKKVLSPYSFIGYDFTDKGIILSFSMKIDVSSLARKLEVKQYDIFYDGKEESTGEHLYTVRED